MLTLAVASYEGKLSPQLKVTLNGEAVGEVTDLLVSGAVHRSGAHAARQEREIVFDAGKLKPGTNTLVLEMPAPAKASGKATNLPAAGLLWDSLRLEIAK